ncbi:hypothetical protein [Tolypothrix sp. VBCCA 56010]|uniref:hypothetical protein n=1 Tax=Tolypothrix sp. VBCCA 56010 TaxID=3137731 RepID=UPI003D7E3ECC
MNARRVIQFSCGAASAVAAKLTISKDPSAVVVNAYVAEEHEDNRRFLHDVERWLGVSIEVLRDEKYGASAYEVFRRAKYTKGMYGAPCSRALKRDLLEAWAKPDDIPVLGFTAEEEDRAERYLDANNGRAEFPLIDAGLTKADCLALIERAGIRPPVMYSLGYNNANCIGCVKGGAGYWNKIRRDFPERFEQMALIEDAIGPSAYLMRNRQSGVRIPLRQLDPKEGRHNVVVPECGFACAAAEEAMSATTTEGSEA